MDDESFKKELLGRLDQIIELLSSALTEVCLVEPEPAASPGRTNHHTEPTAVIANTPYLLNDEMQDNYNFAVQKWRQGKS